MLTNCNAIPTIPVKDLNVARDFYEKKLGLKPVGDIKDEEVQLFKSGDSMVEVYKSDFAGTNKATAMTWTVKDDIESEVKNLSSKGIGFEHYSLPDTKLVGDIHVMGDFKAAWFKDPDGNILCVHNQ